MSLTNPNNVITEERLNEYHNTILPYLGGMPDILANKFSRADLYSTDEKMIGRWTDGKPLYQKIITNVSLPNGTTAKSYAYSSYGITDVDMMMCPLAFVVLSGNTSIVPFPWVNSGNRSIICAITGFTSSAFSLVADSDRSAHKATFVLNYTKTTDSAVEIGLDTDYSTTEKIIGTWIDGKPLYQIVITVNGTFSTMDAEVVDTSSLNIGELVDLRTLDHSHFGAAKFAIIPFAHPEGNWSMTVYINNNNKICVCPGQYMSLVNPTFILQYTKTTD